MEFVIFINVLLLEAFDFTLTASPIALCALFGMRRTGAPSNVPLFLMVFSAPVWFEGLYRAIRLVSRDWFVP